MGKARRGCSLREGLPSGPKGRVPFVLFAARINHLCPFKTEAAETKMPPGGVAWLEGSGEKSSGLIPRCLLSVRLLPVIIHNWGQVSCVDGKGVTKYFSKGGLTRIFTGSKKSCAAF